MAQVSLPDPTEDLHWDDFDRPLHEVFAANAAAHPDRRCVVETSPLREFTYRQIHEASNILAHHLLGSGVERGDVVMLYSYRGVDLVVAIMGVLKAGATFSVIDPTYPPNRQIVYLDVARPRAIVVIKKATESAGGFSQEVTTWINDNLDLKTTVPELILEDDAQLKGGRLNGSEDVLENVQSLRDQTEQFPVIGPDDVPTLSFTSGSEGKPKGVRGRHFSLPHYFPWMAKTFGLSENDRFTMLSGIAHDPIQRDIFTPLFLGASLWVPSAEDIQNELLAEWMAKYETTVTHLTPAMGKIMVADAKIQFPALRNAFFVGDALYKTAVQQLQKLAPNVRVINMFGTTETQRAVSYYAVPSRNSEPNHLDKLPDAIPAGRGMNRVQLLVVDRSNPHRICGIDEPDSGEIYVRAAGLAEGYLEVPGEPELTSKKFIPNWFVDNSKWVTLEKEKLATQAEIPAWRKYYKGPRDRLYRSGDLGKYTSTGDVVCTGRADNQIKIRGFRVELGEIDSHLSSHSLVRENVSLAREPAPGSDGERTIVSYIVPDLQAWEQWHKERNIEDDVSDSSMTGLLKRFHLLREEVRNALKASLAHHSVPSLIIPILRMPLNPNGKPDRPKLPYPTNDELNAARKQTGAQLTQSERKVAEIWARALDGVDADAIQADDQWDNLGGDSLKANGMLRAIRQEMGQASQRDLYNNRSLKEFARLFEPGAHATNGVNGATEAAYSKDAKLLSETLPRRIPTAEGRALKFFLTGATGFLGSFILHNLLSRPETRVIVLVRGGTVDPILRVRETCLAYGLWSDDWRDRLECAVGDLGRDKFGLKPDAWERLSKDVDAVIHNGARVHWLEPYEALRAANVLSTATAIELAATGKAKRVTFVSSTAVLDSDYYLQLSDANGASDIPEQDDLSGSETGLHEGYGQTKWASEYLMREAGRRGLTGSIVRPGYVLGDRKTGVSITDDFLIRMLKGCLQLGSYPPITDSNTINMVPVDHVAHIVAAATIHSPPHNGVAVSNVTPHPRLSWTTFLGSLATYGYAVERATSYEAWKATLLSYVDEAEKPGSQKEPWAGMQLLDLVATDFPTATRPRLLNDANAAAALRADGAASPSSAVTSELVGLYLAYLVRIGYMPPPPPPGSGAEDATREARRPLPAVELPAAQLKALKNLGGRGRVEGGAVQ